MAFLRRRDRENVRYENAPRKNAAAGRRRAVIPDRDAARVVAVEFSCVFFAARARRVAREECVFHDAMSAPRMQIAVNVIGKRRGVYCARRRNKLYDKIILTRNVIPTDYLLLLLFSHAVLNRTPSRDNNEPSCWSH